MGARLRQTRQVLRSHVTPPLTERLVFLHVPKCGGNSVRRALVRAYSRPLIGARHHHFDLVARRSRRAARLCGIPTETLRDHLLRYHLCHRRVRLATGHFRWPAGLRDQFPGTAFVTVLRDPVSHFLSNYYFRSESRFEDERVTDDLPTFLGRDQARWLGCSFVRQFTAGSVRAEAWTEPALDEARRNLARVDVVGVLEDLPGFADSFERRFGARLAIPHLNAGKLRPHRERQEVTPELRARIAELVAPNQALYDHAVRELVGRERQPDPPADRPGSPSLG